MSSISSGTTLTTALVQTADTSGVLQLQTNGTTTAVTIDTNQNVGVGVTPSAWASTYKSIDISGGGSFYGTSATAAQVWNAYNNGTNWIYKSTNSSALYLVSAGTHTWYNAAGGTAGNAITFTQAMTLDASGNVQLGLTTNPQSSRLTVQGAASSIADFESTITTTSGGGIRVSNSGTTELWIGYYQFASNMGAGVTDAGLSARNNLLLDGTNAILFGINGTQKASIDSSGNLLVGFATTPSTGVCGAFSSSVNNYRNFVVYNSYSSGNAGTINSILTSSGNNTSSYHFVANTGGADKFYIYGNGTYGTVSDKNLKKNIETARDGYLDDLKKLRVVKYNWESDDDQTPKELGWIAQEVAEIFPGLVQDGIKQEDGSVYKQVKTSVLPFMLVKAIQELSAQVTTLQSQVTALESK